MNSFPPPASFEICVPASIANLGPGFDTLAVAVQLYLRLSVEIMEGRGQLHFEFPDCRLDGENYVERAFHFLARQSESGFPSLHVQVHSEIPMRSGLGSSAAATVAGLRLYEAVAGRLSTQGLLNAACALEGHPDNVAAALLGGLTVSCQLSDRSAFAISMEWPQAIRFLVLTPTFPLPTSSSRGALPEMLTREDAVFNLQRVALLLQALQTGNFSVLREAMQDRIHQPYRQKLVPCLAEALALQHADLLGICLGGAGPSIVALAERNFDAVEQLLSDTFAPTGLPYTIRRLAAHQSSDSGT